MRQFIDLLLYAFVIGIAVGGIFEVWSAGLFDSAVVMGVLLAAMVQQGFKINRLEKGQP